MPANKQSQTLAQLRQDYPDSYSIGQSELETRHSSATASICSRAAYPTIPLDRLCAIAFTSGSTGKPAPNPKFWRTCRSGSLSNCKLLLDGIDQTINLVATVPAQHMWGMETTVLLPLFGNVAVLNICPFFPQDIADALARLPVPRGLVSSPVHLNALLQSGVQVPAIEKVFTATAPLSQSLATELEARLNTEVVDIFGSSESGILARRRTSYESLWTKADAFSLTPTAEGVEIHADHLPGMVIISDNIELMSDGRFRWMGRKHDMVNIAGRRGSLIDLNQRLLGIPGVDDGVIFFPETNDRRLAALVVAPGLSVTDILNALRPQIEPLFLPRPVYLVDTLPRQETGKLASKDIQTRFQELRKSKSRIRS